MEARSAARQKPLDGTGHAGRRLRLVGEPDKGDMEGFTLRKSADEYLLAETVSLTELALGTVAVDGMAQATLRYAEHDLDTRPTSAVGHGPDNHAQGISRKPPKPLGKEGLDLALKAEVLGLGEGVAESGDRHGVGR